MSRSTNSIEPGLGTAVIELQTAVLHVKIRAALSEISLDYGELDSMNGYTRVLFDGDKINVLIRFDGGSYSQIIFDVPLDLELGSNDAEKFVAFSRELRDIGQLKDCDLELHDGGLYLARTFAHQKCFQVTPKKISEHVTSVVREYRAGRLAARAFLECGGDIKSAITRIKEGSPIEYPSSRLQILSDKSQYDGVEPGVSEVKRIFEFLRNLDRQQITLMYDLLRCKIISELESPDLQFEVVSYSLLVARLPDREPETLVEIQLEKASPWSLHFSVSFLRSVRGDSLSRAEDIVAEAKRIGSLNGFEVERRKRQDTYDYFVTASLAFRGLYELESGKLFKVLNPLLKVAFNLQATMQAVGFLSIS